MKKLNRALVWIALLWVLTDESSHAQIQLPDPVQTNPVPHCVVPKVDGDKVPFPLKNANTKFELAENETYILNGFIVQDQGKTFFKLDFDSQPWLATRKRLQFPYFLVSPADAAQFKSSMNGLVQVAVVTRKSDVSNSGQEWSSNIMLEVITKPIPLTPAYH